jgi:hypothetical protein
MLPRSSRAGPEKALWSAKLTMPDDGILTVFERLAVVWPLDVADTIMEPSSSDEMTEKT